MHLWLDEGIAEYFEVARGKGGVNASHVYHLSNEFRKGNWKPDLARLETLESASALMQEEYAESWLWVHFLLSGDERSRALIQDVFADLKANGTSEPLFPKIEAQIPDFETQLIMHLKMLARE